MVLVLSIEFPRRVLRILLAGAVTETIRTMAGRGVRISSGSPQAPHATDPARHGPGGRSPCLP
ncbi:hypothetical protein, partial [Symbiobacterium thermophilum]|uniref:hypothetical protein n=1 Tax=Symbiobacterium thermophilum TaxID=2734 RepID=UPI0035C74A5A